MFEFREKLFSHMLFKIVQYQTKMQAAKRAQQTKQNKKVK